MQRVDAAAAIEVSGTAHVVVLLAHAPPSRAADRVSPMRLSYLQPFST